MISIEIKDDGFLKRFRPKEMLVKALNKSATNSQIKIKDEVTLKYAVKKTSIRSKIFKATTTNLKSKIRYSNRPVSLTSFTGTRQTKKGVSVAIIKGRRRVIKSGFIQTVKNSRQAFKRKGKTRYPIERLTGPSPGGMVRNVKSGEIAQGELLKNLDYEVKA